MIFHCGYCEHLHKGGGRRPAVDAPPIKLKTWASLIQHLKMVHHFKVIAGKLVRKVEDAQAK